MAKMKQDFQMISGDTKYLKITVDLPSQSDTLNGATIKWGLFHAENKTVLAEKIYEPAGVQDGIEIEDDSNIFTVKIEPQDTNELQGRFLHESQIIDSAGNVSTILKGTVNIIEDWIQ